MEKGKAASLFAPDSIIDTENRMICKLVDGNVVAIEATHQNFWF
jgi:hypothetical protein